MKSTDKFLMAIVFGIILLVGVAFAIAFFRPEPTYLSEDTPEGIANNYLMALQREEYERAYVYLSPFLPGYPATLQDFIDDVNENAWGFRLNQSVSLEVISADVERTRAKVMVRETKFYEGGLFDSGESTNTFDMTLTQKGSNKEWEIIDSDYYWAACWDYSAGCD